jgi:transmembrane protein 222
MSAGQGDLEQNTTCISRPELTATESTMPSTNEPDLSYCILWSPLWPITLFLPFIGHTGIADSRGIACDFQGSYYVGTEGRMAFGAPTRYLKIDIGDLPGGAWAWDEALKEANRIYEGRIHNICCDNCHSHVCTALNHMDLSAYGISKWNMIKLCFLIFFRARFVSIGGAVCQFLPFCIVVMIFAWVNK